MKRIIIICCLSVMIIAGIIVGVYVIHSDNVIEKLSKSVVLLEVYDDRNEMVATGSGYFVYNDRTVVTNYHVIEDAYTITAISDDERKISINTIIEYDEEKDIAILRCDASTGITHIPFAEMDKLKRGQGVIAIGSPLGIQNAVSTGVISSFDNETDVMKIHTTAPISSGSSGGLLATEDGKAIGITSASYIEGQNLNIAIDIREIMGLYGGELKNGTSLADFFGSKEHFYKYKEVTVAEVLKNYRSYDGQDICVIGWVSTSLYDKEVEYPKIMNVLFLVDRIEDVLTKGSFPMSPYADETNEYDRATSLKNIMVPNHGKEIAIIEAGKQVKIYGKVDYDLRFERVGVTPYKIEVLN